MASIIDTQNINNLQAGFTTSKHNPFPVSEPEEAQTYWSGYTYAADGLGTTFNATTTDDRLDTQGDKMFVDGSGQAQYGPVGRMSNSQTSILSSLADQSGDKNPIAFSNEDGPRQLEATFKKSSALRSANISGRLGPGGQAISSGTPVPVNTDIFKYGGNWALELRADVVGVGDEATLTVGGKDLASADFSIFGDRNADDQTNLADFFLWVDAAEEVIEDGNVIAHRTAGDFVMATTRGMSGGTGLEGLLKTV